MGGIKYAVVTEKSVRLLENNQYTSNVESGSSKTEIKHWVELFFGVKVIAMNSHRLPRKGRRMGHTMHYRRMIITLQPGYSIPPLRELIEKRTYRKGSHFISFKEEMEIQLRPIGFEPILKV